jgi:hypothetical protein
MVVSALISMAAVLIWADRSWPRINRESCSKIRARVEAGITLAEVEAVIGAPPGDCSSWTLAPGMRRYVKSYRTD